ncbi:MAG: tetratricopeptide repeat protein, partial [Pseudomonadales bacterium]
MNFSVDKLLQQGIKAHEAGQTKKAEQLYRSILAEEPEHPDANHNLGVLTVALGKVELSLPYFEMALEANPNQGQYWLSMIEALIMVEHLEEAREKLQQSRDHGLKGDKLEQ